MGVDLKQSHTWTIEDSLAELAQLATTAGAEVVGELTQRLDSPSPSHYLGKGKLQELVDLRAYSDASVVVFDDELSPTQQRNLEKLLGVKVIDRTALILDIFAEHARTREGRLQVALAQHEYLLPRLAGQWSHLERLGGGIGTRGPGETQLETDRRLIRQRIARLKKEIEDVRRHRTLHRERRRRQGIPVVALVGYTNAGKSTLLNALTDAGVTAVDQLFATLDPTTRRIRLPGQREALLSDTVGFIQKLPTTLVAAFRATLEELAEADVLLHVVDFTHPNAAEQMETVDRVLADLKLGDKPIVTAFNKVDKILDEQALARGEIPEEARELAAAFPHGVFISAEKRMGLDTLLANVGEMLSPDLVPVAAKVPYGVDGLVDLLRRQGITEEEVYEPDGVRLRGRVPARLMPRFAPYRLR